MSFNTCTLPFYTLRMVQREETMLFTFYLVINDSQSARGSTGVLSNWCSKARTDTTFCLGAPPLEGLWTPCSSLISRSHKFYVSLAIAPGNRTSTVLTGSVLQACSRKVQRASLMLLEHQTRPRHVCTSLTLRARTYVQEQSASREPQQA